MRRLSNYVLAGGLGLACLVSCREDSRSDPVETPLIFEQKTEFSKCTWENPSEFRFEIDSLKSGLYSLYDGSSYLVKHAKENPSLRQITLVGRDYSFKNNQDIIANINLESGEVQLVSAQGLNERFRYSEPELLLLARYWGTEEFFKNFNEQMSSVVYPKNLEKLIKK